MSGRPARFRASTVMVTLATLTAGCTSDSGAPAAGRDRDSSTCAAAGVGEGWEAGADATDIAPTSAQIATGKLYMGAYGLLTEQGAATGVHDDVYAHVVRFCGLPGIRRARRRRHGAHREGHELLART